MTGKTWRTVLIAILGVIAFQALIPLVELIAGEVSDLFWTGARWGPAVLNRSARASGWLTDSTAGEVLFLFLQYVLPAMLFLLCVRIRLRPHLFLALSLLMPFALTGIGMLIFDYELSEYVFLRSILYSVLCGVTGALLMTFNVRNLNHAEAVDAESNKVGIRHNAMRAWLILGFGFFALQAAITLSIYVNDKTWMLLEFHYNTWSWDAGSLRRAYHYDPSYELELVRYGCRWGILYVLPFMFLVTAIYLRLRPWFGLIFGLLLAVCQFGYYWLLEYGSIYNQASKSILIGQCCGVVTVILLWLYHANVTKLQYDVDDDD